jgi:hypothetical protein
MTRNRHYLSAAYVLFVLLTLGAPVWGQTATGRIVGAVQDSTGAIIPGASIAAQNEATGVTYKTVSSEAGKYTFEALPPGSYALTVEANGFKRYTTSKNVLTANDTVTINIPLDPGAVTEAVQVEGTYERVQTSQSGNIGNVVNSKNLVDLPIVGRNPLQLVSYQPGVVQGANTGGGTHIFGARDRAINLTLDGIDANETSAGNATFTPVRTNPDSIQEYRIVTSNPSAEFGRNSGAQIALITKTGTNEFHGNLFEFHRNRVLNANEWDLNRLKFERLAQGNAAAAATFNRRFLLRNQFGGSIGGPIIKNKAFFFFNMQIQRQSQTLDQTSTVYTSQARQGNFRYVVGGRNFPAGAATPSVDAQGNPLPNLTIGTYNAVTNDPRRLGLDSRMQSIIALTPLPNRFDVGDGLNTAGFTSLATRTDPQRDFTTRIDYTFNERHTMFGRYSWGQQDTVGDTTNSGAARYPGLPPVVATFRTPRNLAVGWRSSFGTRTTNELIAGGNYFKFDFAIPTNKDSRTTPIISALFTDPLPNGFGNAREITTYQVIDNLTHVRGSHALRTGINLRLQRHYDVRGSVAGLDVNPRYLIGGAVDPTTFQMPRECTTTITTNCINTNDFARLRSHINDMLGKLNRVDVALVGTSGSYSPPGTPFIFDAYFPEFDVYFQDDWRILSNLTVNMGLRYEPKPKPYARSDARIFAPNQPFVLGAQPSNNLQWVNADLYKSDLNNWSPAVGVAWDPFKDGKSSVRANFRIAYDRISTFLPSSAVFPNVPGITLAVINQVIGQTDNRLRDGIPSLAPPAGASPQSLATPANPGFLSQELLDPNFVSPKTYMWSFGMQREIGKGFVVDAQYIGRAARQLIGGFQRNQAEIFSNGFLAAFNEVKAGRQSTLLDRLTTGHPNRRTGETGADFIRRFFSTTVQNNNVASLAASLNSTLVGGRLLPDANGFGPYFFTPYPQVLGGLAVIDNGSFSNYHGAVFELKRRASSGLDFGISYTFSKSLDDKSFDPTFTRISTGAAQSAQGTPFDPANRRLNYGLSDFDRRHVLNGTVVYDLPFGTGRKFMNNANGFVNRLVGGWTMSANVIAQSGRPFNVVSSTNSFSSVVSSRANYASTDFSTKYTNDPTTGLPFLFTPQQRAQFSLPGPGEYGNVPRNAFRLPPQFNLDAAIIKRVQIREQMNFEFRAEATNVTNTPYFGIPGSTSALSLPTLGRSLGTESAARVIQLGAKINF